VPEARNVEQARALVLEKPRELAPRQLPIPDAAADGAVLRVEACGLCGTDHELYTGALPLGFPFIPGHETVGVIEAIGDDARAAWHVDVGDRVAVEPLLVNRECYGMLPLDRESGLWGGYATHHYLAAGTRVHKVPAGLDPVLATMFNPLGAGIRWAVDVPQTQSGAVVAVLGPGVRGLAAVVAAREAGAAFVMITGRGEHDAPRLELARAFGADLACDVEVDDPVAALRKAVGAGADVVVDVTAKAPAAFAQAVALARRGGTVVVAGTRGVGVGAPGFEPDHVVYKELRILGAFGVDSSAYERAFDLLTSGKYPFADIPRRVADLDGAEDLLLTMAGEAGPPPMHAVIAP